MKENAPAAGSFITHFKMKSPPDSFVFEGVEELLHRWGPHGGWWSEPAAGRGGREMDAAAEREEKARSCRQEFVNIPRRRLPKIPVGDARMRSLVDLAPPPEPQMRRCPSRR
jgi:hypothetical protein